MQVDIEHQRRSGYVTDKIITVTIEDDKDHIGSRSDNRCSMKTKLPQEVVEPLTFSIPFAGALAGIARNASYAAARRGEIPVIKIGGKFRVPAAKWNRILAEGRSGSETE